MESAIHNCDNFQVTKEDVGKIIDWEKTSPKQVEIPFKPARVLLQVPTSIYFSMLTLHRVLFMWISCRNLCLVLQDFTGVPAVVDLAVMRDAMNNLGGDSNKINPLVCFI